MKYLLIALLALSSCQQSITGYEGDLFIPQDFTTTCMEKNDQTVSFETSRDFRLLSNGNIIRKNPEGKNYTFKMVSSASFQTDEKGFCILWLAYDIFAQEVLTVFLYESAITFAYDSGEYCHYSAGCAQEEPLEEISLLKKQVQGSDN